MITCAEKCAPIFPQQSIRRSSVPLHPPRDPLRCMELETLTFGTESFKFRSLRPRHSCSPVEFHHERTKHAVAAVIERGILRSSFDHAEHTQQPPRSFSLSQQHRGRE